MLNSEANGQQDSFNCKKCAKEDTERMVQCDSCDGWFHYDCVGVDDSIEEMDWMCCSCTNAQKSKTLEISKQHNQKEPKSFDKAEGKVININDEISTMHLTNGNKNAKKGTPATCSATFAYQHDRSCLATQKICMSKQLNTEWPTTSARATADETIADKQKQLKLWMLEEQKKLDEQYLQKKFELMSFSDIQNYNSTPQNLRNAPTASQLAARQAIPRELPNFNGNPEEWPLFISAFENTTRIAGYSDEENLYRLQACLKGRAREIVKHKLLLPAMVPEIVKTLRMCFGRPDYILEVVVEKARKFPAPKENLRAMIDYGLLVQDICSVIESCHLDEHLSNPMLVKELVNKLSNHYKLSWAMHPKDQSKPALKVFSEWLYNIATAASEVVPYSSAATTASVNAHFPAELQKKQCFACTERDHKLPMCTKFKNMDLNEKWNLVKTEKLCRQCLNKHKQRCAQNKLCGVNDCRYKHHPLLHRHCNSTSVSFPTHHVPQNESIRSEAFNSHTNSDEYDRPFFRILPVSIHSENSSIDTFAFLDEGSSVTLLDKDLFESLQLKGVSDPLCLSWTGDTKRAEDGSMRTSLQITGTLNDKKYTLNNVRTVENLGLPTQTVNAQALIKKFPQLKGIPLQSYTNATPKLLIGSDNWHLAMPLKAREGKTWQPIASKSRLGWAVQGGSRYTQKHQFLNVHTCECQQRLIELHDEVKEHFSLEASETKSISSKEDTRALSILESTCKKRDAKFETGLLWKSDIVQLPESYNTAYRRLMCLRKKFRNDPGLEEAMQQQINNLISKGYARKLTKEESSVQNGKIWYLPIFIARNPNKPEKLRLVWDAAAKSQGVSLNNFLLSGPDLLNPLFDVLINFRVGRIAVCGDIAEMFHQINVQHEDMHVQRFLWKSRSDVLDQPSEYVMQALTFGMNCAPCIAHYVRNKNASEFQQTYPRAVEAITKYHYVDDFIDSVNSEEDAIELALQVKIIHSAASFHVRNWACNSKAVLSKVLDSQELDKKNISLCSTEKVLGMFWDSSADTFRYVFRFVKLQRNVILEEVTPTKREVLQVLMSIFDPMGYLLCYTISLKILLQDIWRSGIGWDEEVNEFLLPKWLDWKNIIQCITNLEIPRCFSPFYLEAKNVQLHTFADAGEYAYAAVSYLRFEYYDRIAVSLVAARSKVAPLSPLSIPRLELQAAVLAVRLCNKIAKALRISISKTLFWTDSKTVLQWLRMDPRKFQQFVMHRVGEILENSNPDQWNWVPSKSNPADLATKPLTQTNVDLWFNGPPYLKENVDSWPKSKTLTKVSDTDELKRPFFYIEKRENNDFMLNVEYFSDWRRLYRAVATFLLYIKRLYNIVKQKNHRIQLSSSFIADAKTILIKYAQQSEFSRDITQLTNKGLVEKSSKLIDLNPYIDREGLLRSRSRAEFLITEDVIVLPNKHHVTYLIVRNYHTKYHHVSHETVINTIRGKYYIPKLRILYKSVRKLCQFCRNKDVMPLVPQMAPLPRARLAAFQLPFTYVGIDYFGPFYVTVHRRKEKRWGVIFTCLTLRAVHIEVAHTLDASSCMLCLQNFMARRGTPREIYTDNGTNFRCAEKLLTEMQKRIDYTEIIRKYDDIKWFFNPPAAPHMGGAWERLVRSIKTILLAIFPSFNFNEETIRSSMCEVEFIINSRPLTFVSLESRDDEALTPNHLLIGSSGGQKPTGDPNSEIRQQWQQAQAFANHFWKRWVKEYAPNLSRRSKWFAKQRPIETGDVVIIVDENLPRNSWPKGIILSTIKASDGQVRRATVKTATGVYERPAAKIAVLDIGK